MSSEPDEIPLFPLPSVVLFPLATVPLFVFEPRYRQMIAAVLEQTPSRIGIVSVPEAHHEEMAGDPPIEEVGCEGEVAAAERNPDGTYRILLRGTRRFRIVNEQRPEGDRLYRLAQIEPRAEIVEDGDRDAMRAGRGELLTLLSDLLQRTSPRHASAFDRSRFDEVGDEQLVNALAQAVDLEAHDKQQLLEVDRVCTRQHMLSELLRFRIAQLEGGGSAGPTTLQ